MDPKSVWGERESRMSLPPFLTSKERYKRGSSTREFTPTPCWAASGTAKKVENVLSEAARPTECREGANLYRSSYKVDGKSRSGKPRLECIARKGHYCPCVHYTERAGTAQKEAGPRTEKTLLPLQQCINPFQFRPRTCCSAKTRSSQCVRTRKE